MMDKSCPSCGASVSIWKQFKAKFYCNKCNKKLVSRINIIFIVCALLAHFIGAGIGAAVNSDTDYVNNIGLDNLLILLKVIVFIPLFLIGERLFGKIELE